ncbi:MAG: tyrosine-type recombinase/integrase, partial [Proteobacteria bacterium]|nr:tyrosine-type recombinase/integrase [Pseudomonadota bacterium]
MLNVNDVKNANAREKAYKLFDDRGLYLLINSNGSKLWRYKYRFDRREKTLALGPYPEVSLSRARNKRDDARKLLRAEGIDPCAQRRAEKTARLVAQSNTFKAIAEEWLQTRCPGTKRAKGRPSDETVRQLRLRLTKYVYPRIGSQSIADIVLNDIRAVLAPIGRCGNHETAHRVRSLCERIYRYAIATERADRNIAADLKGTLAPTETEGFSAITEAPQFGELLNAIDSYSGQPATMAALKLAPLVFVRPIELRAAEWREIDLAAKRWSIPDERMKERRPHVVPLSKQAVVIIQDLKPITGTGRYLFPCLRSPTRPLSDNTLNAAMRRLGYSKKEMTTHGFRKSASTLLHEMGFSPDEIETQLAHK